MNPAVRTVIIAVTAVGAHTMSVAREPAQLRAVPFTAVQIADEFWSGRLKTVVEQTLPHCFEQCRQTGRLRNFDKAAGRLKGEFEGYYFNDSDVYKVLEGAAYALMYQRDPQLEAYVDELIARIAAAQDDDGYLDTYFTLTPSEQRWSNTAVRHELYCAGHLIEAAVAYYQATGKRALLDVAIRLADHVDTVFGPDRRHDVPGHEEIELALIRLHRLTGEGKYRRLAEFFIEQRGQADGRELYGEYCQDYAPVRRHTHIVGHAVRAMYLYSAVADLVATTGDPGLLDALERIWRDTIESKLYVTGGIGSSRHNEGFTEAYDLPNETAYCETCAAIALCFWSHRLNLLHADARYADVLERALYNNVLAGIALDGKRFFYVNPLASSGDHHRQPWYACACCPTNVVRFLPAVGQYVYARTDDAIYVNLYVAGTAEVQLADDCVVVVRQETRYPWDGAVKLTVEPPAEREFELNLRIPAWCHGATLRVAGQAVNPVATHRGYAQVRRRWRPGDIVELDLPMPVERVVADARVAADRGRVALQRGPLVYCLENVDQDVDVRLLALPRGLPSQPADEPLPAAEDALAPGQVATELRPDLLNGIVALRGTAITATAGDPRAWDPALYRRAAAARPVEFLAIPYYAWDNRAPGAMVVWLPESPALLNPLPVSWVRPSASHCYQDDTLIALHDRREPADSGDQRIPRFTWWPRRGTTEWVQYDFEHPRKISSVDVYWFDDSSHGGDCRAPASWKLLYRVGPDWRVVSNASGCGIALNQYNHVTFEAVATSALRIEVRLEDQLCAGLLEWKVGLAD